VDHPTVAVVKDETVVSHAPRKISWMCSLFLRCGRSITCQVTWARKYSTGLSQGSTIATLCANRMDVFLIHSS